MIKRRFYKMEHGDRDDASNQSSSSSDSEIEAEAEASEGSEYDDDDAVEDAEQPCSNSSSGYKSEDSSANETLVDMSGCPVDDGNERESLKDDQVFGKSGSEFQELSSNTVADKESLSVDLPEYVVKRKSIFKCRICPRIVCLNEEALRAHLKSKRHARSEKLLNEGRLKTVLNSDGKLDEEETPALYARILASSQALPRKKSKQEDKSRPRKKRMRYDNKKSKGSSGKKRRQ
ncbi:uncharacterized protein LOC133714755 [Rosa rugosa]|uniref:uncharacterized protein LOC133714755 n=1 Tax=Rosa rugosa TaxID=74645 RepID=UPI002B403291|nr:uncharacterized protein LOC133714755 [Rosa rugosa]